MNVLGFDLTVSDEIGQMGFGSCCRSHDQYHPTYRLNAGRARLVQNLRRNLVSLLAVANDFDFDELMVGEGPF